MLFQLFWISLLTLHELAMGLYLLSNPVSLLSWLSRQGDMKESTPYV